MATQDDKSPVASLMEDLGIGSDESTPEMEEESNNPESNESNDADAPTPEEDGKAPEEAEETDTAEADTDTSEDELTALKAELDKANKRISDKDKYINELRQGKTEKTETEKTVGDDKTVDEDFWDDPEGKFKDLLGQLHMANLRIDENAYAMKHSDYFEIVNAESIQEAFSTNPEFQEEFQTSSKPYETAYTFLKANLETKQLNDKQQKEQLESEIRDKVLSELGIDKDTPKKKVPPNMQSLGSSSSTEKGASEDGFTSVFGGM